MAKIEAKAFYNSLMEALKEDETKAINKYRNSGKWTTYLAKAIQEILEQNFGLRTNKEYFCIDLIGWSGNTDWEQKDMFGYEKHIAVQKNKKDSALKLNEHNWNLEIAVEYENDPLDWMYEVIKLCHIKCGLKVVIGYSDINNRQDKEKLQLAAKHINSLTHAKLNADEGFLIILGNCNSKKYEDFESLGLVGYEFIGGEFKLL